MTDDLFNNTNVHETSPDILFHLTNEEKTIVEKFRKLLQVKRIKRDIITDEKKEVTEDGPVLVAYKEKMKVYLDASRDYKKAENYFLNAKSATDITKWRHMVEDRKIVLNFAYYDWVVGGYKNEVEAMVSYIDQVTKRNSSTNVHETAPDIPLQLTKEEIAKVEKYRNLLYVKKEKWDQIAEVKIEVIKETTMMAAYKKKQLDYLQRSAEYQEAEICLLDAKSPEDISECRIIEEERRQLLSSAHSDWVVSGYKNEVEQMAAYIDQVTKRNIGNTNTNGEHIVH